MKFPSIFTKTPQNKKFNYTPRYYNPEEDERKMREERIRREVDDEQIVQAPSAHALRITGSFKRSQRSRRSGIPPIGILRFVILLFLVLLLIVYLQYGNIALYGLGLMAPFYLYLRFRRPKA